MLPRDIVLGQIRHQDTPRVPYTLPFEPEVGERLDAHFGGPSWRGRLVPYLFTVAAVETDIRTPIDATRHRDGYGGVWRSDRRPWHLETPPLVRPSLEGYAFPKAERFLRPEWKERALLACSEHRESFIVASLGWGLFERSWNLRGFENVLVDAVTEPEFFAEVLDRLTELYLQFVRYTVDLPVDGVLFGDDWGDQRGVILGPERWRTFLKPRWARIYKAVHDAGKIAMNHSCGSVVQIIPDLIDIGLDVLESVQPEAAGMVPYELKKRFGRNIAFWGGLGSQSVIPFGTPARIAAEVARLRREMPEGGGYILAPAKPLQPETPTANAAAIVDAFTA
jgi:uroporphyrinogen decarboxylase